MCVLRMSGMVRLCWHSRDTCCLTECQWRVCPVCQACCCTVETIKVLTCKCHGVHFEAAVNVRTRCVCGFELGDVVSVDVSGFPLRLKG